MPAIVGLRCANPTYDLQVNKLQIGINNDKFETERQLTQNSRLFAFICGLKKIIRDYLRPILLLIVRGLLFSCGRFAGAYVR
jgi:hypothetical protein